MKGGLLANMKARLFDEEPRDIPDDPVDEMPSHDNEGHQQGALGLTLKRRRYGGLYKKLLTDAGYGDMAKMVNVRHQSERGENDGY